MSGWSMNSRRDLLISKSWNTSEFRSIELLTEVHETTGIYLAYEHRKGLVT